MAKITIKQHDITDCGAACLASVAAHHGLQLPISRIRQFACTDKKGTNVFGLIKAAEKIGFEAKGVRGDFESLFQVPKPAIAHIIIKERLHHYVVIYRITKKHVFIMDPGTGKLEKRIHERFKKEWTGVLVLLLPNHGFRKGNTKVSIYSRFWYLLQPHRTVLLQAFVGALVYTLLGFSTAIYLQKITDHVLVDGNIKLLNLMSLVMLLLLLARLVVGGYKDIFLIKTGLQIDARLILGYYKHLLKLPQRFFDTMRVGEIISRIGDAVKIRNFINGVALSLSVNLLIVFFSFVLMFSYYWKLALIMGLLLPLYLLLYGIVNRLNKKVERKVMENAADLESQLVESLNAVGTLKSFGLEEFANLKTETKFIKLLRTGYTSALNAIFSQISSQNVAQLFTIILLWLGSGFVIAQEITPGELLSFYAIVGYFTGPLISLIGANKEIQNALIAADRLFEIFDLEQEASEQKIVLTTEKIGDIRFEKVGFSYGTRVEVFKDFDLTLKKGEITAFVGESGSGKSTLVALLQNLYPLNDGNIFIGETNLKYVEAESLRQLVAVVPQKIDLFAGNVIQNIAVGELEPDMERVLRICKDIGVLAFIEGLPDGFGTYLGENGAALSGGQKQRIAIARALYKQPEILVLDEATASLDSSSESYVQRTVDMLRQQKKTIVIIAHRLSTVVNADRIVVLEKGRVLEQGSHEVLYEKKGAYYQLWRQQLPRFTVKLKSVS